MPGNRRDQQCAELGGERVLAGGRSPGGQAFESHSGFGLQLQQALGVLPHHVEILFRHADQDQVGERLFGFGIGLQNALVKFGSVVRVPQRLQGSGLSEERLLVFRGDLQAALKREERRLGIFQPEVAHAQPQVRIQMFGVQRTCLVEGFGSVVPLALAFQADGQVEPSHGVLGLDLSQDAITLARLLVIAHLELDVRHGAINLGRRQVGRYGTLQLGERFIASPGQVQRHRLGQIARP